MTNEPVQKQLKYNFNDPEIAAIMAQFLADPRKPNRQRMRHLASLLRRLKRKREVPK